MRRTLVKIISAVLFVAVVVALLAFNALVVWVATGPRSLAFALPYIEQALQAGSPAYSVKIGEGALMWDGWRHPIDIRLRRVDVFTRGDVRFATFPDVSLGLDLFSLALGRVEPTSLRVHRPVISLLQGEDGSINFGINDAAAPSANTSNTTETLHEAIPALLAAFADGQGGGLLQELHLIAIDDADVSVGSLRRGVVLHAPEVNIQVERRWHRGSELRFSARVTQEGRLPAVFALDAEASRERPIRTVLRAENVWPPAFAPLVSGNAAEILAALRLPLSAQVEEAFDRAGAPQDGSFSFQGEQGEIADARLAGPLPLAKLRAEGKLSRDGAALSALSAEVAGTQVQGSGALKGVGGDAELTGTFELQGGEVKQVGLFWPPSLSPESRAWVVSNITAGALPRITAILSLHRSDLDKPQLPDDAVQATIEYDHATVRFLPQQPPIIEAKGLVRVNIKGLEAEAASAQFLSGTHASGRMAIPDLNADNPEINVQFHADSAAADVVRFLSAPPISKADRLHLNADAAKGTFSGDAKVSFFYTAPRDAHGHIRDDMGVTYAISGAAAHVSHPGLLGKFDIENFNGNVAADNAGLDVKGTAQVNGAEAEGRVRYMYTPQNRLDTFIDVAARAPVSALKHFGYPDMPFLTGVLGVKASVKQGPDVEHTEAAVDLKEAAIDWAKMHWKKLAGAPASLTLSVEKNNGALTIPDFRFTADGVDASGNAVLGADVSRIAQLHLAQFKLGANDLALDYAEIPGGYRIAARGASADVSGWLEGDGANNFSFKKFPALELSLDLKKLTLGKDRTFTGLSGTMECSAVLCSQADISGNATGAFRFQIIQKPVEKRALSITAENAGAFLRDSGIYDNMHGGKLNLIGAFDDTQAAHPLSGTLTISEHTISGAPVLAELLTLASLTGFVDTLQGKGITFTKCEAPFTLQNDIITLSDAKSHGDALGISVDGTITFPGQKLDLRGTVVPSYTINTLLGHVPLVGNALTGGGEGIIGARYSMTGTADKADVSVNPLSMLTPGFLRGVFDIFDRPAPEAAPTSSPESQSDSKVIQK